MRWSGSRARTSRRYASRPAPTRSPPSSRRPTTSWLRPTPTVTCPLHLLLRRRELLRIPILRGWVNRPFGFASHGDDDLSSGVSFFQVPDGIGDLGERVGPVDDRCDLPRFDEVLED